MTRFLPGLAALRGIAWTALVVCVLAGLSGCGAGVMARKLVRSDLYATVESAPDANLNNPVALDIVLVYNEDLEQELLGLTARQWMEKKAQFKLDHRLNEDYVLWELEPVPGLDMEDLELPLTVSGKAFIVFVDYYTPGDHRVRTDPRHSFIIRLKQRNFVVEMIQ
ncbi:MAG: hypothetical protein AB7E47_04330 [Desulfovibrionaceae bacterium]